MPGLLRVRQAAGMEPFSTTFTIDRALALRANRAVSRRAATTRLIIAVLLVVEALLLGWWWLLLFAVALVALPELHLHREVGAFARDPSDVRVTISEATYQVETPDSRGVFSWTAFRTAERAGEFCVLHLRHIGRMWLPLGALAPEERGALEAHLRSLGLLESPPAPEPDPDLDEG